jgi:NNP family nitrate/nitrite transporter-like MFS transporter
MGAIYSASNDYTWGFILLAATAAVSAVVTATAVRRRADAPVVHA